MKVNNIKNIKPGRELPKKIFAILLCTIIVIGAYMFLDNASKEARNTVDVVRLRGRNGVPANTLITRDLLEIYSIIEAEYTSDMLKYSELDEALNMHTQYFLRGRSILYKDQYTQEKPLKNDWLYNVADGNEVLTIPYNFMEAGGNILVPADQIRLRAIYANSSSGAVDRETMTRSTGTHTVEVLFENITVRDLLNSQGNSIYDIYRELSRLGEEERKKAMEGRDFLSRITPRALVLEATPEQIDRYSLYKGKRDLSFTITILSRKNNDMVDGLFEFIGEEVS